MMLNFIEDRPEPPTHRPPRPPTIAVVINTPTLKIVDIGETTQFGCSGYYLINNVSKLNFNTNMYIFIHFIPLF